MRPGRSTPIASDSHRLDEDGPALDSLERLTLASALTATLHLQESGLEDLLLARQTFQDWVDICAQSLAHFDTRLTFHTSGSSGKPKACTHSLQTLWQELYFLATLFEHTTRILYAVPTHHIYGFMFAILLPTHLRVPRFDIRQMTPQSVRKKLLSGDLIVSHPAHWGVLERASMSFACDVTGVTSTAPCPSELAQGLLASGLQQLVQVYGSSESAGVGWRVNPHEPYCLMPFWSRDPLDSTALLRTDPNGLQRSFTPQDHLDWQADSRFMPAGRKDEAVQVNGINVYPARVRQKLLEHPHIADVAVRVMRPSEGNGLKAFIVPIHGTDPQQLAADLPRWISTRMTAPERPKSFTVGTVLPSHSHGKLADWRV